MWRDDGRNGEKLQYDPEVCEKPKAIRSYSRIVSGYQTLPGRHDGNDGELISLAIEEAEKIASGHTFIVYMKNAFPINVLPRIRQIPEIVTIFCATANPVQVILAETEQGRGVLGVIDGFSPKGVENKEDIAWRKKFLRDIGYKF